MAEVEVWAKAAGGAMVAPVAPVKTAAAVVMVAYAGAEASGELVAANGATAAVATRIRHSLGKL